MPSSESLVLWTIVFLTSQRQDDIREEDDDDGGNNSHEAGLVASMAGSEAAVDEKLRLSTLRLFQGGRPIPNSRSVGRGLTRSCRTLQSCCPGRAGHFRYFLIFSIIKNAFLPFFIKLIWLGVGFSSRTGAEIGCYVDKKCKNHFLLLTILKNTESAKVPFRP